MIELRADRHTSTYASAPTLGLPLVLLCLVAARATATGLMLPDKAGLPALAIKHQRVSAVVQDLVARTSVKQVFLNSTNRQLEATYVFPLPAGASVTEFAMMVNGKRVTAELVEKDKARRIYEDIVRRMRDPGLLEYLGSNLFKARVFPIPPRGTQEVEIQYSEVLSKDSGICRYVYPLRTAEKASSTLEDFTVSVRVSSREPIRTVYSPSHSVDVVKKDDHHASAGFEGIRHRLDTDFVLYWTVSDKEFGVNLVTQRERGKDGFFLLMVSPRTESEKGKVMSKDMVFVVDTSGSMSGGNKIQQAREALEYCVNNLNPGDRFNIVRFSTEVETFDPGLVSVERASVARATEFVRSFPARGGTDIHSALTTALGMKTAGSRPFIVVFLTDGIPTVGTTSPDDIVVDVSKRNAERARIFCFGVGYDVNTHLLDRVSGESRGSTEYVKPEENIEVKVSLFFNKASEPVLARPELDFGTARVFDVYPRTLPDLFKGSQLLVFGRYKDHGPTAITLRGEVEGKTSRHVYEGTFRQEERGNGFVERLWATRKIGYLLDEIRLQGETGELRDEVIRLSRQYGIVTPYTSFLVVEDGEPAVAGPPRPVPLEGDVRMGGGGRRAGLRARGAGGPAGDASTPPARRQWGSFRTKEAKPAAEPAYDRATTVRTVSSKRESSMTNALTAGSQVGQDAVVLSEELSELKRAESESRAGSGAVRAVGGKVFRLVAGVWTDEAYRREKTLIHVKYAGRGYFRLLDVRPDLRQYLAMGPRIVVVISEGVALRIDDDGKDDLTEEQWQRLRQG